jgi:2'-hydroxyisoflavone reductase
LAVEQRLAGPFNLAGPRLRWSDWLALLGAKNLAWVGAEVLRGAGVSEFELPLYRPERGPRSGLMDVSSARAEAAGLVLTDAEQTLGDVRQWMAGRAETRLLSPEREAELIQRARCR